MDEIKVILTKNQIAFIQQTLDSFTRQNGLQVAQPCLELAIVLDKAVKEQDKKE